MSLHVYGVSAERLTTGINRDIQRLAPVTKSRRSLEQLQILLVVGRIGAVELDPFPGGRQPARLERDGVVLRELRLGRRRREGAVPTPSPLMQANMRSLTK